MNATYSLIFSSGKLEPIRRTTSSFYLVLSPIFHEKFLFEKTFSLDVLEWKPLGSFLISCFFASPICHWKKIHFDEKLPLPPSGSFYFTRNILHLPLNFSTPVGKWWNPRQRDLQLWTVVFESYRVPNQSLASLVRGKTALLLEILERFRFNIIRNPNPLVLSSCGHFKLYSVNENAS